jgi:DNA (cytosine-5)-methyltransferase 1
VRELSLFSGAGGGLLGSKILGWTTVGYVEYEPYCQKVLRQRIADGILDAAPIFGDIRKFLSEGYADAYQGMVDIVTGGFPCTDISCAKTDGKGIEGEESGLWVEMFNIIGAVRPRYVLVENSPMLTIRGGARVIGDFASMGYDARWGIVGGIAGSYGLKRERMWILAVNHKFNGARLQIQERTDFEGKVRFMPTPISFSDVNENWLMAHGLGVRMVDDVAGIMDRIKAIGNGQVPLCMAYAYEILSRGVVEMTPGGEGIE